MDAAAKAVRVVLTTLIGLVAGFAGVIAGAVALVLVLSIPILVGWSAALFVPGWAGACVGVIVLAASWPLLSRGAENIGRLLQRLLKRFA